MERSDAGSRWRCGSWHAPQLRSHARACARQTVRFKNELERNITIKLGYANAKIYKCEDEACPRPACYRCAQLPSLVLRSGG